MKRSLLCATVAVGTVLAAVAPVGAAPPHTERVEDVWSEDFVDCGGLSLHQDGYIAIRRTTHFRGPDQVPYYAAQLRGTVVTTNTDNDNDKSLTVRFIINEKDQLVTDNGDGTIALLVKGTGDVTLIGPDGKVIAKNPGQARWTFDVDLNGTPDDFEDDIVSDPVIVKDSTGRNDFADHTFCGDVQQYLS